MVLTGILARLFGRRPPTLRQPEDAPPRAGSARTPEASPRPRQETRPIPPIAPADPAPEPDPEGDPAGALLRDGASDLLDGLIDDTLDLGDDTSDEDTEPAAPGEEPEDADPAVGADTEVESMFADVAAGYVRPVRQFHSRLEKGPVSNGWLHICRPAVEMVARSARGMGFDRVVGPLESYAVLLGEAAQRDEGPVDGTTREVLLQAHAEVARVLPQAFLPEDGDGAGDGILVHSLLDGIPHVGKVTLDKVFGTGLTSIEMLEIATARDLAATTGVPMELCEDIHRTVRSYVAARDARRGDASRRAWQEAVRDAVERLRDHNTAYQRCLALTRDDDERRTLREKKAHRRERHAANLELQVLLAEMDKVDLVEELERLPFDRRVDQLVDLIASFGVPNETGTVHSLPEGRTNI